ncbi:MAG: tyrosine-type recombinase/integrase [Vulcanimicrobiota bacterium]
MSTIRESLEQYVAVRRALGSQFLEPAGALSQFVDFVEGSGSEFITIEHAVRWATKPQFVQRATWSRRLCQVRGFARWLSAIEPRTEVPPRGLLRIGHRRNRPYIYADEEIEKLMNEAAALPSASGLRGQTYEALIGMLASTGLRPGEALALNRADVELQTGILSVRQTKHGKSRFVPVEHSVQEAFRRYTRRRDELCPHPRDDAFLLSERGSRLKGHSARRTFARISRAIGIREALARPGIGRGPRLQDFRHTFATKKIIEWYRAGLDIQQELPKLSRYLGHSQTVDTYWYIQAVPELLRLATERLERVGDR